MTVIAALLVLSLSLGMMTYFLGVLIYALPIPLRGIKKWGPLLMSDGILTITMSLLYAIVIYAIHEVFALLGLNRDKLVSDIVNIANTIARLYIFFKLIKTFYSALFSLKLFGLPIGTVIKALYEMVSAVQPLNNPASSFTLDMLIMTFRLGAYAWTLVYILSVVSELLLPILLALGTLMLGIPFRLTKSAGASIIGFAIATYIITPLIVPLLVLLKSYDPTLAFLIDWILHLSTGGASLGVVYPYGKVVDAKGNAIPYVYIKFCDGSGICGIYPTYGDGSFTTYLPLGGVPWPTSAVYLDVYGVKYYLGVLNWERMDLKAGESGAVTIKAQGVRVLDKGIAVVGDVDVLEFKSVQQQGTDTVTMKFVLRAKSDTEVHIVIYDNLEGNVEVASSREAINSTLVTTSWMGQPAYYVTFHMERRSVATVYVEGKVGTFRPPSYYTIGYLARKMGVDVKMMFVKEGYQSFDYLLLAPFVVSSLPLMHLLIVGLVARAIASLISEGAKNMLVRMW